MHFYHFGIFDWQNAGDTAVEETTEKLIGEGYWERYPIYYKLPINNICEHINRNIDAVVIGGGGYLIPTNSDSGWYLPLSTDQLKQIKKPIIVFALGYGRFWRQKDFNELFLRNINQLVEQSAFFGLRNHGSLIKLTQYLKPSLADKLRYQPDPVTLSSYIYPEYQNTELRENEITLQPALDGLEYRFGERTREILESIARAMKELQGFKIRLALHISRGNADYGMVEYLDKAGVKYDLVKLYGKPHKDVMSFYAGCPLTIAMRGHGIMLPFGLGNAFVPLISHDKIRFLLDDIGITKGIYVTEPDLTQRIVETVNRVDHNAFRERIGQVKQQLWEVTQENLKIIQTAIKK
jgi:polysaccharide pyruvyl transferase WcaK-like protein